MVRLRRFIFLLLNLRGYSLRMMLADRSRMVPNPAPNRFMIGPTNECSWSYSTITVTWSTVFAGVLPATVTVCVVIWAHIESFTTAAPHARTGPLRPLAVR